MAKHGAANEMFSFAADTAEKVGLSRRSIEIAVKIWKDLSVVSRQRCVGIATLIVFIVLVTLSGGLASTPRLSPRTSKECLLDDLRKGYV